MLRQRHQARLRRPVTVVFPALMEVAGERRWLAASLPSMTMERRGAPVRVGLRYEWCGGSLRRRGRVLECLRPVALTLTETLHDPPCHVRMRLRWRLEPTDEGALVQLEVRYELNSAAYLNKRRWRAQIHGYCERSLRALASAAEAGFERQESGRSGHSTGNNSMTVTNTRIERGSPTLR